MDLSKILNVIYRYMGLLVLAALIASAVTFVQLSLQPPAYRATTDLLVGPSLDSPSPDLNSLRIGGQLALTYAEIVDTPSFLETVNSKLDQKMDINVLRDAISTSESADTRLLTITVFYPDPKQAVAIANAAAQTLLEISPAEDNVTASLRTQMSEQSHQLEQIVGDSQARIEQLEAQLAALKETSAVSADQQQLNEALLRISQLEAELATLRESSPTTPEEAQANLDRQNIVLQLIAEERNNLPEATNLNLQQQSLVVKELGEERSRLSDSLRTLATIYEILLDTNTNQVQIIQSATSAILVDRQLLLRVLSAGIGGLIFALIVIFIAEYFDDRLRFPSDLSRAAGVPLLSVIDKYSNRKGNGLDRLVTFTQPDSEAANRYREVVAKLLFTIGASIPYTILVNSVGAKNGAAAAISAGNLAVAFAQAGYKVALIDAQLDNPALTAIFKTEKKQGRVERSNGPPLLTIDRLPSIRLLPADSITEKNSRVMLNPGNVAGLFYRLQKEADIVLVAGSEASHLAENLTLATQVDSVVLVARHAEARNKDVHSVAENLRLMNINIAGVIFDYNSPPSISTKDRGVGYKEWETTPQEAITQETIAQKS